MNYRERQVREILKKANNRIEYLENLTDKDLLDLEQECKDKDWEIIALKKEVHDHEKGLTGIVNALGKDEITNLEDLKDVLKGKTLKEWVEQQTFQIKQITKIYEEGKNQLIKERTQIKEHEKEKRQKLQSEYDNWKEVLNKFLQQYKVDKLDDLQTLITEKDKEIKGMVKLVEDWLKKNKVKKFEEVEKKIEELEESKEKEKAGEKAFKELVEIIKPKSVIFLGKKKTKEKLSELKSIFGWDKVDAEGISEEEV